MTDREKLAGAMLALCKECVADDHAFATDNNDGGKWIPVTERVPEQYESVIVWAKWGEMGEAEHDGKWFRWVYDNDFAYATHWMPLPEPPKEGE